MQSTLRPANGFVKRNSRKKAPYKISVAAFGRKPHFSIFMACGALPRRRYETKKRFLNWRIFTAAA
jgi:hypothetical protein